MRARWDKDIWYTRRFLLVVSPAGRPKKESRAIMHTGGQELLPGRLPPARPPRRPGRLALILPALPLTASEQVHALAKGLKQAAQK